MSKGDTRPPFSSHLIGHDTPMSRHPGKSTPKSPEVHMYAPPKGVLQSGLWTEIPALFSPLDRVTPGLEWRAVPNEKGTSSTAGRLTPVSER